MIHVPPINGVSSSGGDPIISAGPALDAMLVNLPCRLLLSISPFTWQLRFGSEMSVCNVSVPHHTARRQLGGLRRLSFERLGYQPRHWILRLVHRAEARPLSAKIRLREIGYEASERCELNEACVFFLRPNQTTELTA